MDFQSHTLEDFESCIDGITHDLLLPSEFILFLDEVIGLAQINLVNNFVEHGFEQQIVDLMLLRNDNIDNVKQFATQLRTNINALLNE